PFNIVITHTLGYTRGELDVPRKIAIDHDLHVVAQVAAEFCDELLHFFDALASAFDAPWRGDFHAEKSAVPPGVRVIGVNSGIAGDGFLGLATEDFIDGEFLCFSNEIVKGEVHTGHGHASDAADTVRQRGTVHL